MKRKTLPTPRRDVITLADLAPRHRVTGGSERRVFGADPIVHARESTMPVRKDLPVSKDIKGGKKAL
jgi:hypothetical protein